MCVCIVSVRSWIRAGEGECAFELLCAKGGATFYTSKLRILWLNNGPKHSSGYKKLFNTFLYGHMEEPLTSSFIYF